ncbi:nucleotidyltransferase family protein [Galbibacter sp. EGI 63066]|uniref:nucleotidyltransferase family protein n=1 Tax=Galbibacter sp. EGI 63066 TaxID=2993559 RepID=UPI0022494973|nr:nucleotidyltransferase family protein [Galbibacter sp. EGI 63066]MCX2681279.1 nucleotidyltransferase family protein [Galbibacter sp. EGI 63066]
MMTIDKIKQIIAPILKKYNIKRAGVFGSYVKGGNTEESDIDILVELESKISLLEFVKIKLDLEDLLGKNVDLVEYGAIKPRLKEQILSEEMKIYG